MSTQKKKRRDKEIKKEEPCDVLEGQRIAFLCGQYPSWNPKKPGGLLRWSAYCVIEKPLKRRENENLPE